uniref:Nicotianamine synthase n=1 Tax=Rhizophora mucronata TaxID=61149 RepID=A0A2P2P8J3_RHIMU
MDKEKKVQVIDHLAEHMAPGAFLLLRSAHGARAFLYPVIDPHALNGFEVLSVFHPTDEVINSVIVSRKIPTLITSCSQGLSSALFSSKCSDICGFNSLSNGNRFEELTVDEQQS